MFFIGTCFLMDTKVFAQCEGCLGSSPNLVVDGGFEGTNCTNNTGTLPFTTAMFFSCATGNSWPIPDHHEGVFALDLNRLSNWGAPHTGSNYFIGDGLWGNAASNIAWSQSVNIVAGQTYRFGCWIIIEDAGNPGLQLAIGGNILATLAPSSVGQWSYLCANYVATFSGAVQLNIYKLQLSNFSYSGNDFGIDDIEFRALVPFNGTISPDQIICSGKSVTLTAAGTVGSGNYSYLWNNGSIQSQITVAPTTTTSYSVIITDNTTGCKLPLVTQIIINNLNVTIGKNDIELCSAYPNVLPANVTGGTPPYTYLWNTGATTSSITVNYNNPGTYTVTVTDNLGCTATNNVVTWQTPGNCDPYKLFQNTSNLPAYNRYNQYIRAGNNVDPGSTQGNVIVTSSQNVKFKAGQYISMEPGFSTQTGGVFDAEIFNVCVLEGQNIQVTDNLCSYTLTPITSGGTGNFSYLWNTGATTSQITVNPTVATNYSVTITDNCLGGYVTLQVTVTPHYRGALEYSLFPNLVTPNGDGYNDLWHLYDYGKTQYAYNAYSATLEVYNIWGGEVWTVTRSAAPGSTGLSETSIWWDPNNPDVTDDVYYAEITLKNCDQTTTIVGWVQVLGGQGNRIAANTVVTFSDTMNYSQGSSLKDNNIVISPNPSSGEFDIFFPNETDKSSLYIYNNVGEKIREILLEDSVRTYKVDLTSEENGMYLIRINSGGEFITKKIILKK
jgi:hypothetical protein